jgi:hypothetical protein
VHFFILGFVHKECTVSIQRQVVSKQLPVSKPKDFETVNGSKSCAWTQFGERCSNIQKLCLSASSWSMRMAVVWDKWNF